MSNIYVTPETKKKLEDVCKLEKRTQDGQINYFCEKRIAELEADK